MVVSDLCQTKHSRQCSRVVLQPHAGLTEDSTACAVLPPVAALSHVETDTASDAHKAELIDGKAIAQTIRKEVAGEISKLRDKYGKVVFGSFCDMWANCSSTCTDSWPLCLGRQHYHVHESATLHDPQAFAPCYTCYCFCRALV